MPLPTVGQTATRALTLTAGHVSTFAALTGDYNPLHFDEAFALGTRFGRLVVQGGLTTGLLHALVAMDLPGPGPVFLSQNWKFTAPVYIGDTITAHAEVLSFHAASPSPNCASPSAAKTAKPSWKAKPGAIRSSRDKGNASTIFISGG